MNAESKYSNETPVSSSKNVKNLSSKSISEKPKNVEASMQSDKKASAPILRKKSSKSSSSKK